MSEVCVEMSTLESASWPVMLVDASAAVLRTNAAAQNFFGDKLKGNATLASLWTTENELTPGAFITRVREGKGFTGQLRLRGKGIAITPFTLCACVQGEEIVIQLLPAPNGAIARPADKNNSVEVNVAQKQKLDCALQLTRTVALDFNNTLTAILGHATHVLAAAEQTHPWRKPAATSTT